MLERPYLELLCALIGMLAGSVIVYSAPRLVAYRLPEPIPFPGPMVLIPLFGAWRQGWRPVSTCVVEGLTALVLVLLALRDGASRTLLFAGACSVIFIAIGYIDIDYRLVLNRISYPAVVLALLTANLWPHHSVLYAVLGAVAGGVVFLVLQIVGRGRLGTGDTKLAILIGAVQGFPDVLTSLFVGMLFGGIGAVVLMVVLRRGRKDYFAYAPYLSAGAIVTFLTTLT
ncbi:MAG: hypothetical protein PVSMB7_22220 [Chloroflexota bacterium]